MRCSRHKLQLLPQQATNCTRLDLKANLNSSVRETGLDSAILMCTQSLVWSSTQDIALLAIRSYYALLRHRGYTENI